MKEYIPNDASEVSSMARTQRDFTQGPIAKSMIAFSLPFLLSNIL